MACSLFAFVRPAPSMDYSRRTTEPMLRQISLVILLLMSFDCAPATRGSTSGSGVISTTIYRDLGSGRGQTVREVVRDSARWQSLWESIRGGRREDQPAPPVDFELYMLLVAVGPAAGAGDSVVIDQVRIGERPRSARVTVYRNCYPPDVITMPVHAIRVRVAHGGVQFRERIVRGPHCRPLDA
jgi:hypothetical protein